MIIALVLLGFLLLIALVIVHEWGHFIMARRNGVEVEEFGIGFPPKLKTLYKDKKGTEYTLNLLPLGGFVRLKGEHDSDKAKGAFGSVSLWAKTKIILAGVVMNLFTAWIMFSLLALVGVPKLPLPNGEEQFTIASDTTIVSNRVLVGYVEPDGPADKAGLRTGDEIKGFNCSFTDPAPQRLSCDQGILIEQATMVRTQTEDLLAKGNASVNIIISRDDVYRLLVVYPRSLEEVESSRLTDTPKGYLGVVPQDFTIQRSTWSAPIVGVGLITQYSRLTYQAIGDSIASLFQGKGSEASENVAGPVGIFFVLKDGATLGVSYILLIVASLSLTLAIMNTLPIPALDGGKLAVMLIFRAIKKPLTPEMEERIHGSGFVLLMGLFVLITVVDVRRFF